jgi:hypothetical protein
VRVLGHMRSLVPGSIAGWSFVLGALAVGGCADIWGFDDLTLAPDSGFDATAAEAGTSSGGESGTGDGEVEQDASPADANGLEASLLDSGIDGALDASDAGALEDGAPTCASICSGCCDAMGRCVTSTSTSACGIHGAACATCTTSSCPPLAAACCGATSGACGCIVVAVCTKN